MSASSGGDQLAGPAASGNAGVQHGQPPPSSSSSSLPPPPPPSHPSSRLPAAGVGADVATDRQLNMQHRINADSNIIAASIRKGKAAHQKKQADNHEHKAVDPLSSSSSSSSAAACAASSSPASLPSPLSAVPSISSVHCGVLCLDSTKSSSLRNNPTAITSWVQSHYPNVSSHSVVDHLTNRYLHLHFRSETDLLNAMSSSLDPLPSNRILRCFGFSPAPCSGKKFPESIKCTVAGFTPSQHETSKGNAPADFTSFLQSLTSSSLLIDQQSVIFSDSSSTRVCYARLHILADVHSLISNHDTKHTQLWGRDVTIEAPHIPSLTLCRECNGRGHMRDKCPSLQERTIRLLFRSAVGEEAKQQVAAIAQAQHVYIGVRRTGSKTILTSHCIHITYRNTELGSIAMAAGVEAIVASFAHDLYCDPLLVDLSQIRSTNMCDMCGDTDHRAVMCSKFDHNSFSYASASQSHTNSQPPSNSSSIHPSRLANFSSRITSSTPQKSKVSRVCYRWRDSGVCLPHTRNECPFEHLDSTRNKPIPVGICRDYQVGKCGRGQSCLFAHDSGLETATSIKTSTTITTSTSTSSSLLPYSSLSKPPPNHDLPPHPPSPPLSLSLSPDPPAPTTSLPHSNGKNEVLTDTQSHSTITNNPTNTSNLHLSTPSTSSPTTIQSDKPPKNPSTSTSNQRKRTRNDLTTSTPTPIHTHNRWSEIESDGSNTDIESGADEIEDIHDTTMSDNDSSSTIDDSSATTLNTTSSHTSTSSTSTSTPPTSTSTHSTSTPTHSTTSSTQLTSTPKQQPSTPTHLISTPTHSSTTSAPLTPTHTTSTSTPAPTTTTSTTSTSTSTSSPTSGKSSTIDPPVRSSSLSGLTSPQKSITNTSSRPSRLKK